jgi:hypothetical protein
MEQMDILSPNSLPLKIFRITPVFPRLCSDLSRKPFVFHVGRGYPDLRFT